MLFTVTHVAGAFGVTVTAMTIISRYTTIAPVAVVLLNQKIEILRVQETKDLGRNIMSKCELWEQAKARYANKTPRIVKRNGQYHAIDSVLRSPIVSADTRQDCIKQWRLYEARAFASTIASKVIL